jgi:hypothetical protein
MARVTKKSLEQENEGLVAIIQMQSVIMSEALKVAQELSERLEKAEKKLKKYKDLDNDMDKFDRTLYKKRPQEPRWQ